MRRTIKIMGAAIAFGTVCLVVMYILGYTLGNSHNVPNIIDFYMSNHTARGRYGMFLPMWVLPVFIYGCAIFGAVCAIKDPHCKY